MTAHTQEKIPLLTLGTVFQRLGRSWRLLLALVLLFGLAGGVYGALTPASYQASSRIQVIQPSAIGEIRLPTLDMDTEEALAGSRSVLEQAAQQLPQEASQLRSMIEVAGHSNSTILDVTATASDPQQAADIANRVAQAYLGYRKQELTGQLESYRQASSSSSNQKELSLSGGKIISQAQVPSKPSNFSPLQTAFIGAGLGLLLGLPLAYAADRYARRLASPQRLADIAASPVALLVEDDQEESLSLLLRQLGLPQGQLAEAGLRGLTVYSPQPELARHLGRLLAHQLSPTPQLLDTALYSSASPAELAQAIESQQPLIVTAGQGSSLSQALLAADQTGALLLAFDATSSVAQVRRILASLTLDRQVKLLCLFYRPSSQKG